MLLVTLKENSINTIDEIIKTTESSAYMAEEFKEN